MKRLKDAIARLRARSRFVDHVMSMHEHYNEVRGGMLAGAVTYFGFLSFFPILALAFFAVGYLKQVFPESEDALKTAIQQVLPGIISREDNPPNGQISFQQIQDAMAIAGVVGLLGVLYAGLGWLSALREALVASFKVPATRQDNLVIGKLKDLVMLVVIGFVLIVSVSIAGVVTGYAQDILDFAGLPGAVGNVLLWALTVVVGVAASTLLFFTMYRLLPATTLPPRALWRGAVLAAIGFEVLKELAFLVLAGARGSAFAPLALSLTLLVWISYFARVTLYGAAWAFTAVPVGATPQSAVPRALADPAPDAPPPSEPGVGVVRPAIVVGALAVAGWAWIRREKERS